MNADNKLKYNKRASQPWILQSHKTIRVRFAEKHMSWIGDWKFVVVMIRINLIWSVPVVFKNIRAIFDENEKLGIQETSKIDH